VQRQGHSREPSARSSSPPERHCRDLSDPACPSRRGGAIVAAKHSWFVDGWIIDAATEAAGPDEDQTLDLTEALARHSLIYLNVADRGPRSRLLSDARRRGYTQWSAPAAANVSKRVSNRP
jgi:hypothetical protein